MQDQPHIIEETEDFAVVYKPPKMHTAALGKKIGDTLTGWFISVYQDKDLPENGLMHRLDFDTHGLVLFAKNLKTYEFFKNLQEKGEFVKKYTAVCSSSDPKDLSSDPKDLSSDPKDLSSDPKDGFPPPPSLDGISPDFHFGSSVPIVIESFFRPYGKGRKLVRPVLEPVKYHEIAKDNGGFYRTEILGLSNSGQGRVFTLQIRRGFRHQIRCHLRWIGCPILNDPLYNASCESGQPLALCAYALFFTDPSTGGRCECIIASD